MKNIFIKEYDRLYDDLNDWEKREVEIWYEHLSNYPYKDLNEREKNFLDRIQDAQDEGEWPEDYMGYNEPLPEDSK
jgi:hypothetical protein